MRTKNAKRLWPVPATLAVMAVAAFLAFGLMATTGGQPAAAQDKPCITVNADAAATDQRPTTDPSAATGCNSAVTPAVIELAGQTSQATTAVSNFVIYGPGIGGADTNVYPPGTEYGDHDASDATDDVFFTGDAPAGVKVEPLPGIAIQVGPGTVDISGTPVGSKKTFTVAGTPPKTVTVYVAQGTGFTGEVAPVVGGEDVPETGGKASLALTESRVQQLDIVFLGVPAVGKDGADFNNKIDDVELEQCHLTIDTTRMKLVDEAEDCSANDDWSNNTEINDALESRSKLVVRTGAATVVTSIATPLIDGKMVTHTLEGSLDTVTIYALVEDGAGKPLLDTEVSFRSTTTPAGIVAPRDLSDDVETKAVIISGIATRDQIFVDGLQLNDTPSVGAIIEEDDAVASYTLDALPNDDDDAYRITVEVMAGNVKLGTVIIERTGDPVVLKAGVFNVECLVKGTADDYSDATVDLEAKDCDDSGMASRFGRGDTIVVKAHLEDSLGSVVGSSSSLDSELADEFDDPLDLDGPDTIDTPVTGKTMPKAWVYEVDEGAQLGVHMITVSTTAQNADDEDIDDVTLTITVAGPPAAFTISGPDRIDLGGSGTFTVAAADTNGGSPHFTIDEDTDDSMVGLFIQGLTPGNVRGLTAASMLDLDDDTGMGSFTIYSPPGTVDGATVRIFVGEGDLEASHTVVFGMNNLPMGADIADVMMTMGDDPMMVEAMFTDAEGQDLTYEWMSSDEMVATVMADDMDMSMASITAVGVGTATITVTATDSEGGMGMQTFMVTVNPENMAPMASEEGIADQMVDAGSYVMVDVSGAFSDADMDMLTYSAESDMMDYATVSVDGSMVTITGVAEGTATITVTAMDPDGATAMQEIMVTVNPENMAPMASEEGIADQMVDAGSYVMVDVSGAFSDADMDMLTYSAESDMMDYATVSVDGSMVTITGVAEGTATITVTAMDPDGATAMQEIMVTVMMMPPMELGAAMDLTATANDDGSITLMWTRGGNATHHFVSGNSAAVWEFAGGMSSHTVSIDKLVSGTEYTFYVISGRFMEADDGTWPGEWSSAGWTNAAKVTAQ